MTHGHVHVACSLLLPLIFSVRWIQVYCVVEHRVASPNSSSAAEIFYVRAKMPRPPFSGATRRACMQTCSSKCSPTDKVYALHFFSFNRLFNPGLFPSSLPLSTLLYARPPPGDVKSLFFLRHLWRSLVPDGAGIYPRAAGQREKP